MKRILFLLLNLITISATAQAPWTTSGANIYNVDAGSSNIGSKLVAKFNIYQANALGTTAGNKLLLSTIAGNGNSATGNVIQDNIWLVRNSAGNDWYSTSVHDGLSVDFSFITPQSSTMTWWERNPGADIQSWGNGNQTYLTLAQGNLSIGTNDSKGYKFAVNGSAIATSVTVKLNTNWPDYVFDGDYQLYNLKSVKEYIQANHHLPDMPSAADVAKNGLNLGEANKALTKKVEELTLYLIEKDNQVTQQQQQISNILKDNINLHKQLLELGKQVLKIKNQHKKSSKK